MITSDQKHHPFEGRADTLKETVSLMADDLDGYIDAVRSETQTRAIFAEWMARRERFRTFPWKPLTPLKCPHLDLLVEFSQRALAVRLGEQRHILTAPDGQLYAFRLFDISKSRDGKRPAWSVARELRRTSTEIVNDGQIATELSVRLGDHDNPGYVSANWIIAGSAMYEYSFFNTWSDREYFGRACAKSLTA
jgi:hypothetical protein